MIRRGSRVRRTAEALRRALGARTPASALRPNLGDVVEVKFLPMFYDDPNDSRGWVADVIWRSSHPVALTHFLTDLEEVEDDEGDGRPQAAAGEGDGHPGLE